jgi:CRP-like cAMP-binding protein
VPPDELVLTDSERRLALRRVVGFDRLASEELAAIAKRTRRHELGDGAILATHDEPRVSAHLVLSGNVDVVRDGRPWRFAPERPLIDLFWLARDPAPLELKVRGGAVTLELAFDELEEILADHFSLWLATTAALAGALLDIQMNVTPGSGVVRVDRGPDVQRFSDRLSALRRGLAFTDGAVDALAQLADAAVEVGYEAGTTLWRAGDAATDIIIPIDGAVRGVPVDHLGALGGLEVAAGRPRHTTVTAVTRLHALRIDREELLDMFEDHQDLARYAMSMLAQSLIRRVDGEPGIPAG